MRDVSVNLLKKLGYQTLSAADGDQALEVLRSGDKIDLLFSDVIMPGGIDGFELVQLARKQYPELKILLTSGFTGKDQKLGLNISAVPATFKDHLLRKPFYRKELALNVRQALDKKG